MSILIPGMDMPTSCVGCEWRDAEAGGDCELMIRNPFESYEEQYKHCPFQEISKCYSLTPVPDHGRLIDADALEMERRAENAKKGWYDSFAVVFNGDPYYEAVYDCTEQFKELVNNAPTIIPADPADKEVDNG